MRTPLSARFGWFFTEFYPASAPPPPTRVGEAVRWSKNKEEFGKGKLKVISSETANNAATGAAMIHLVLAFMC